MKTFSKILFAGIMLAAGTLTSCTDYQDEIDALDDRVTILENLVGKANSNIDAMKTLVNAMADGWVITGMAEVDADKDPDGRGYRIITFGKYAQTIDPQTGVKVIVTDPATGEPVMSSSPNDKKTIILYNGLNGEDGEDAAAPELSLKKGTDGNYYWWIGGPNDGDYLKDDQGNPIRANGKDGENGKNGKDGENGKDGKMPQLGINADKQWIVSYDGGATWDLLRDSEGNPISAVGKDGTNGVNGKNGDKGDKGDDAFEFIVSAQINIDKDGNRFVVFVLWDGTEVTLPLKS